MTALAAGPSPLLPRWLLVTRAGVGLAVLAGLPAALFQVDPVDTTVSEAVFEPGGIEWLAGSVTGLVVAAAGAAVGVLRSPLTGRVRRWLLTLLALWAVSLVAVVAFPTNLPGAVVGFETRVHQVGAGGVVIAPMLLAVLIAPVRGDPRARALRAAVLTVAALGVVFAALHVPVFLADASSPVTTVPYLGLVERLMLVAVLAVLLLTTGELARAPGAAPTTTPTGAQGDDAEGPPPVRLDLSLQGWLPAARQGHRRTHPAASDRSSAGPVSARGRAGARGGPSPRRAGPRGRARP